jgi:ATP-binding cassette subfamily C protein
MSDRTASLSRILKTASRPSAAAGAPRQELRQALQSCRSAFVGVGLMTGMINVLYLTGSFFMLQVYDRVIPSRSMPTLVGLCILAFGLYVFQAALEILRTRILSRIGACLDASLGRRVFQALVRLPLRSHQGGDGVAPLRDLDQVRGFLSGLGPTALFDLPWIPLYLGLCFLFHPLIGWTATVGALLIVTMTFLTDCFTKQPSKAAIVCAMERASLAESGRRNAEVVRALGMEERMATRWCEANDRYMATQQSVADIAGGFGGVSKVLRMVLQSGVLAVGAFLVVHGDATGGIMIASSILVTRALAPAELAIAHWKGFIAARQGWARLGELLSAFPQTAEPMPLEKPRKSLSVEAITGSPPNMPRPTVSDVSFALKAGQGLGIVGPSASGKSSLARLVAGVWHPQRGKVRLDGAAIEQWSPDQLGRSLGYLPQDVELFAGTIAQNIARFEPGAAPDDIVAAAKAAGVHELVLGMPEGYETDIGEGGVALSAGQRQRIALARALYGEPFLVILDEPNSNLDAEGDEALTQAILGVRARGGIVIVVAHRPSALTGVDHILMMLGGRVQQFGPKEQILAKLQPGGGQPRPAAAAQGPGTVRVSMPTPLRVVAASSKGGQS